jgi:hypothetical protein
MGRVLSGLDRATFLLLVGFVPVAILIVVAFDVLLGVGASQVGPNPTFDQAFAIMNWGSLVVALLTVGATLLLIRSRKTAIWVPFVGVALLMALFVASFSVL